MDAPGPGLAGGLPGERLDLWERAPASLFNGMWMTPLDLAWSTTLERFPAAVAALAST